MHLMLQDKHPMKVTAITVLAHAQQMTRIASSLLVPSKSGNVTRHI